MTMPGSGQGISFPVSVELEELGVEVFSVGELSLEVLIEQPLLASNLSSLKLCN